MREDNFRTIREQELLDIPGPKNPNKERGWVAEPDRQLAILNHFWGKLERGSSLIFFY
jgi:hypothetical protein